MCLLTKIHCYPHCNATRRAYRAHTHARTAAAALGRISIWRHQSRVLLQGESRRVGMIYGPWAHSFRRMRGRILSACHMKNFTSTCSNVCSGSPGKASPVPSSIGGIFSLGRHPLSTAWWLTGMLATQCRGRRRGAKGAACTWKRVGPLGVGEMLLDLAICDLTYVDVVMQTSRSAQIKPGDMPQEG